MVKRGRSGSPDEGSRTPVIDLADSGRRAALFQRVRDDHSVEIAEDYVELISDLIEHHGEARLVDLAALLGVTPPTVNATVQRLQKDGYVDSRPYRAIFLTRRGRELAEWSRARHRVVLDFLHALGIAPETAEADAEGLEHHLSDETVAALKRLTASLAQD